MLCIAVVDDMGILENIMSVLERGVTVGGYTIYGKYMGTGRFIEEHNIHVYIKRHVYEDVLLYMKLFEGRKPYYKPWIELYNIRKTVVLGHRVVEFFDTEIEDTILNLVASSLENGGKIYVEYINDIETSIQLSRGYPIPVTRLGYKLFLRGFTWFKDWYFPEGFMEGNPKIQGEKPLDKRHEVRQLKEIAKDVEEFLKQYSSVQKDMYLNRSIRRGYEVLKIVSYRLKNIARN